MTAKHATDGVDHPVAIDILLRTVDDGLKHVLGTNHDRLKLVISPLDIKGTATILIDELIVILTSPWRDDPSALRIPLLASCKIQAVVLAHGSMGAPLDKDAGG